MSLKVLLPHLSSCIALFGTQELALLELLRGRQCAFLAGLYTCLPLDHTREGTSAVLELIRHLDHSVGLPGLTPGSSGVRNLYKKQWGVKRQSFLPALH